MPLDPVIAVHLARSVELAADNVERGGRPFGAVIVKGGVVLAEAVNTTLDTMDPSAHAEVEAIRAACRASSDIRLDGAVLYASCEPCVMCQALGWATGVEAMHFARSAEGAAQAGWPYSPGALDLQAHWRATMGTYARHHDLPGADEPFRRWLARA